jgi:hypothetical protein
MEKTWWQKYWGVVVILGLIAFFVIAGVGVSSNPREPQDLNASVVATQDGVYITNDEVSDWTSCMVGVDGSSVDPMYQTQSTLTFVAGEKKLVSYQEMTTNDGTRFDVATHAVNNVAIICNPETTQTRYWSGSTSSD